MVVCETQRLIIRELTKCDAEFIYRLMNSAGWLKHIGDRNIDSIETAATYIEESFRKAYQDNNFGFWAVIDKITNQALGINGLIKRNELEHVDIGFAFLPEFMGHGFAYESSVAILAYGKLVLDIDPIIAITSKNNHSSQKLLTKLGMQNTRIEFIKEEWGESMVFEFPLSA